MMFCVSLSPGACHIYAEKSRVMCAGRPHNMATEVSQRICNCEFLCAECPSGPFSLSFLYYHPALGCQLVHERFAQHEILHVDRINQKEEIKVGFAPKWFSLRRRGVLQCHLSLLLSPISHARSLSLSRSQDKRAGPASGLYIGHSFSHQHTHIYKWLANMADSFCSICVSVCAAAAIKALSK